MTPVSDARLAVIVSEQARTLAREFEDGGEFQSIAAELAEARKRLRFISEHAMLGCQTAVSPEVRLTVLREIRSAVKDGKFPDWWPLAPLDPTPMCQKCGVKLIEGPTSRDHERYERRICGGCEDE